MSSLLPWQKQLWQHMMRDGEFYGHAVLLKGRKGIGKLSFALYLVRSLLCKNPATDYGACEQCKSCSWFEQQTHPNFSLISPAAITETDQTVEIVDDEADQQSAVNKTKKKQSRQISVSQIRELDDFVYLSGHQAGHKIVLIYPAETMNMAASNALLKKLEEKQTKMQKRHQRQNCLEKNLIQVCFMFKLLITTRV